MTLTLAQQLNLGYLDDILKRKGFVIFICGTKERGKTNLALLLSEYCFEKGYKNDIATNIKIEDYRIQHKITNYEDLDLWLKTFGNKLYILDELGKHLRKMGFMTKKSQLIMDAIQLIWHFQAGFIGCAPSESFVDNNFLERDILDAKIRKINQKTALVFDYLRNETYFLYGLPTTSIRYNRFDIADFDLKRKLQIDPNMRKCCQVALSYTINKTYGKTAKIFNIQPEEVRRLVIEHVKHTV